jgi:uncharacterized protein YecE (DUF72 family)
MTNYFLGCSGFYYNHWKTKFYPQTLPKTKWLQYYAEHFNTVEINNTFYRFPTEQLLQGWYNKSPANFRFTLKANRAITHTRKFHNTEDQTKRFYQLASTLKEKLLCVLFQLPPFVHKNMDLLQTIAGQMDADFVNVLEFRHESWWSSEVYEFMERHGLVFCTVSASELPETLVATSDSVYVRFHGKDFCIYKGFYPDEELASWAEKIRQANPKQVFCYFNNDVNAYAPKNCQTLKTLLTPNS